MLEGLCDKLVHVTFRTPPRVMLMDRSTPITAATGSLHEEVQGAGFRDMVALRTKLLYPLGSTSAVTMHAELRVATAEIVSVVEIKGKDPR